MAGDTDWVDIQAAIQAWVVAGSGLPAGSVVWGRQVPGPRPAAPAIVMQLGGVDDIGVPWVDQTNNPLTFSPATVTGVNVGTSTLTVSGFTFLTGDGPVQFASTVSLPAPLLPNVDYWLISTGSNTVQVASSYANTGGGQGAGNPTTPITLTSSGSGTITISAVAKTVRAGQEFLMLARGLSRVALELRCHASAGVGINAAEAILNRVRRRRVWPSQRALLSAWNVSAYGADKVRTLAGIKDAVIFEPKAILVVYLCLADEEADAPVTRIEITKIQGTIQEPVGQVTENITVNNSDT